MLAARAALAGPPSFSGVPFAHDGAGLLGVDRAEVEPAGDLGVRLDLGYVKSPLRFDFGPGARP